MSRSRTTAKAAGTAFETAVARYLSAALGDDRIERRARTGAADRGDIAGVRAQGQRVVLECKSTARTDLAGWKAEADLEAGNDDALVGLVVAKRHGVGITTHDSTGQQWVHMTLSDLARLLGA